jgi:hypothetical protein
MRFLNITLLVLLLVGLLGVPVARAQEQPLPVWGVVTGASAGVTFEDIDAVSPTEAWAVGYAGEPRIGVVYRLTLQEGGWQVSRALEVPTPLRAVDVVAQDLLWAVGDDGLIVRRDPSGWSTERAPSPVASLSAVAISADGSEGWAGGVASFPGGETRTTLVRYSAGVWRLDPSISTYGTIEDIWLEEGAAWAVGAGGLWRYSQGFWASEAPPPTCEGGVCFTTLTGVWSPGGDEVWVTGTWGSSCFACTKAGPLLARRAPDGWQILFPIGANGLGGIRSSGPPLYAPLLALDFYDGQSGIAVGGFQDPTTPGPVVPLLARYFGDGWGRVQEPPVNGTLRGVVMTGREQALAVGERGLILSLGYPVAPMPTRWEPDPRDPQRRYFAETGHTLGGRFREYWERSGGLQQFGYPLTEPFVEEGRVVQYFERARFELHPENRAPYDVLLGLLARETTLTRQSEAPFLSPAEPQPGRRYFAETGHNLAPELAGYWARSGGLPVYGYPISEPFVETNSADRQPYLVQYFERNRLEYHPELPERYRVSLGLLGAEILRGRGWLR